MDRTEDDRHRDFLRDCLSHLHELSVRLIEGGHDLPAAYRQELAAAGAITESLGLTLLSPEELPPSGLTQVELDLGELMEEASRCFAQFAASNGHELYCFVSPDLPQALFGDRNKLRKLLHLLLLYACYARRKGDVHLQLSIDAYDRDQYQVVIRVDVSSVADTPFRHRHSRASIQPLTDQLGGSLDIRPREETLSWIAGLPLDRVSVITSPTPTDLLRGTSAAIVGDSPLAGILRVYLRAQGAILKDRLADADVILVAARPPEAEACCQRLREEHPGKQLLCQGATGRELSNVLLDCDSILPMPLSRAELIQCVLNVTEPYAVPPAREPTTVKEPARRRVESYSAKVLLAEDDTIGAKVAIHFLEQAGCRIKHTLDGQAALRELTTGGYDVAILDMQMPLLSGTEVARQYRGWEAEQGKARLPLVALTANASEQDRRSCKAAGMDGFITKPVSREELLDALDRHIATHTKTSVAEQK